MTDNEKDEQSKEVYARAGLALYWAQCLEKSLENFLVINARLTGECISLEQLDKFEERVEAQTLGRLLADARKHVQFNKDAVKLLATALKRRNYLAHRFFKERVEDSMTRAGRDRMIAELTEIQVCFQRADWVGSVICKGLQKVLGISDEKLEQEFKRLFPDEDM